jgi:hypothetical protein
MRGMGKAGRIYVRPFLLIQTKYNLVITKATKFNLV